MNTTVRTRIRIADLLNPVEVSKPDLPLPVITLTSQADMEMGTYLPKVKQNPSLLMPPKVRGFSPKLYLTPPMSPTLQRRLPFEAMALLTKAALASSDDDTASSSQTSVSQSSENSDGTVKPKFTRKRRKFHEVVRKFVCGHNGCKRAYGYLNHLNFHIEKAGHGEKRLRERGSRQEKDDRVRNVY